MDTTNAVAVWKSIRRHHPFFEAGGMFGFDWHTFHISDPLACAVLREAVRLAASERGSK